MHTIFEVKNILFNSEFSRFPYLNNFSENPYTYIKARYYMYCSVLLVYILLRTRIKPNVVTIAYILSGVLGGVLLAVPNLSCNIAGVFVFFNKGILDWSDGHLARIKYQPSLTGHILDVYGAVINSIGFSIGLGFFSLHHTEQEWLVYIIAIIPVLHGYKYTSFANIVILADIKNIISNSYQAKTGDHKSLNLKFTKNDNIYPRFVEFFRNFLDDRARTVDSILFLIFVDLYFQINIIFYVFILLTLKMLTQFLLTFIVGIRSRSAEAIADDICIYYMDKQHK
jgi:hypothetical protein